MRLLTLAVAALAGSAVATSSHRPHLHHRNTLNQTVPSCRAVPGGAGWPSADLWSALNTTVEGRLLKPAPPGAVCHPSQPTYSKDACTAVQANWTDEFFHSSNPVSVEWNNWTNDTCLPDASQPCSGEGYPVYVVNATTPQHVQAAVKFAQANNVRLIVKNSGHDYVGRSAAPYALSIWVHYMKNTTVHPTSFSPAKCSNVTIKGAALTAGAGIQMYEAYALTHTINHTVVGGNGRTVALGGFITGGGHSILAPQHGLATDSVLEMEIVSPTGDILTLNECQNTDLFWAMRGGGGSTFGVLTSVTMALIPSPEVVGMTFWIGTGADNTQAFDMLAYVVSQFPDLADAGISGYPIVFNTVKNFIDGSDTFIKGIIGKLILPGSSNATQLVEKIKPIFQHVNATWPGMFGEYNTTYYPDFQAWYAENFDPSPTGHENLMSSRLLDRPALTSDLAALKLALAKFSASGQATVYIVSGPAVHKAQPRGGGNAVLPVWRRTYVHATASIAYYTPNNSTYLADAKELTGFFSSAMRDLAPDTGAYMNEASKYETDWQTTFWGEHYARLLLIKRQVDPTDVFWCTPCVGSERWAEEADGSLCRV